MIAFRIPSFLHTLIISYYTSNEYLSGSMHPPFLMTYQQSSASVVLSFKVESHKQMWIALTILNDLMLNTSITLSTWFAMCFDRFSQEFRDLISRIWMFGSYRWISWWWCDDALTSGCALIRSTASEKIAVVLSEPNNSLPTKNKRPPVNATPARITPTFTVALDAATTDKDKP